MSHIIDPTNPQTEFEQKLAVSVEEYLKTMDVETPNNKQQTTEGFSA